MMAPPLQSSSNGPAEPVTTASRPRRLFAGRPRDEEGAVETAQQVESVYAATAGASAATVLILYLVFGEEEHLLEEELVRTARELRTTEDDMFGYDQGPLVEVLVAKLHRVVCTEANVDYIGSVTVDGEWLDESGLFEGQRVDVANLRNGERFSTYLIRGKEGSKTVCTNGAAAHLVVPGDRLIIMAYGMMTREQYSKFKPGILLFEEESDFHVANGVVEFRKPPCYRLVSKTFDVRGMNNL